MVNIYQNVIVDSDFIFGYFIREDPHYESVHKIFQKLEGKANLILVNITKYEIATLISRRFSQDLAKSIIKEMEIFDFQDIFIDSKIEAEIWDEFNLHSKKSISLIDCANLVFARKLNAKIASFDKFYPSEMLISF